MDVKTVPSQEKKAWAESRLRQKHQELGRLPRKADFDQGTRCRIKAFLGPWPRALEAAGLKQAKERPGKKRSWRHYKSLTNKNLKGREL